MKPMIENSVITCKPKLSAIAEIPLHIFVRSEIIDKSIDILWEQWTDPLHMEVIDIIIGVVSVVLLPVIVARVAIKSAKTHKKCREYAAQNSDRRASRYLSLRMIPARYREGLE